MLVSRKAALTTLSCRREIQRERELSWMLCCCCLLCWATDVETPAEEDDYGRRSSEEGGAPNETGEELTAAAASDPEANQVLSFLGSKRLTTRLPVLAFVIKVGGLGGGGFTSNGGFGEPAQVDPATPLTLHSFPLFKISPLTVLGFGQLQSP